MLRKKSIYKCELCGNIVESLWNGKPPISCCGQPMQELVADTVDAAKEKHVPVIESKNGVVTVKVGAVAHPMEEKHYIEWIELLADGVAYRKFLKPGGEPVAVFDGVSAASVSAREYCNLHGLWKA